MAGYTFGNWENFLTKQDIKIVRNSEEITNPEKLAEPLTPTSAKSQRNY
jgi:hypothetical protein